MTGILAPRPTTGTLRLGLFKEAPQLLATLAAVQPEPDPAGLEERTRRKEENLRQERGLQRQTRAYKKEKRVGK